MILPGTRAKIAATDSAFMFALTAPAKPIPPMESPHLPGGLLKRQAA